MSNICVTLDETQEAQLDATSRAEGLSKSEWVRRAVETQLYLKRVHELRARTIQKLESEGVEYSDEDVFRIVS